MGVVLLDMQAFFKKIAVALGNLAATCIIHDEMKKRFIFACIAFYANAMQR